MAEIGEQHHADGDADHAERQLKDAVGIIEPRHHAVLQARDDGRDDDGDLRHAAGDEARHGEAHQPLHLGGEPGALELEANAGSHGGNGHDRDLQQAGDGDAPGERHTGGILLARAGGDETEQDRDEHDIEQARREGGGGEAPERVEQPGIERDPGHEDEIGQRDARQEDREPELVRIVGEAGGEQQHEPRHGDLGQDYEGHEHEGEAGERQRGEVSRRLWALGVQALGEQRNEGRVEGAFGKQAPEHIGHAEADEEGIGHGGGAEHGGDQHVADEAEHAAHDSHAADGQEPAIKLHGAL